MTTKNKIHTDITKQLDAQGLSYELLTDTKLADIESAWKKKFIATNTATHLDNYKWHIFSFHPDLCLQGDHAVKEYEKQYPTDLYIFNERLLYGIRCIKANKLPDIQMDDFFDDIYICQHNMKWTYVIPHEFPDMGPYFSH